jgi:hypothetical protein
MSSKIKILVCTHKSSHFPSNDVYFPIQAGKSIASIDLGIQGDDTGDHISDKNKLYCEMTAVYWAWKNLAPLHPELKYIGLCHYRRYFILQHIYIKKFFKHLFFYIKNIICALLNLQRKYYLFDSQLVRSFDQGEKMIDDFARKILYFLKNNKIDILTAKPVRFYWIDVKSFFSVIGEYHIDLLKEIVEDSYPKYAVFLMRILDGFALSAANMFIMRTELFNDYCSFVFSVLERHLFLCKKREICFDPENEKVYNRVLGYLSELLTYCFILFQQKNGKTVRYVNKLLVSDFRKQETQKIY